VKEKGFIVLSKSMTTSLPASTPDEFGAGDLDVIVGGGACGSVVKEKVLPLAETPDFPLMPERSFTVTVSPASKGLDGVKTTMRELSARTNDPAAGPLSDPVVLKVLVLTDPSRTDVENFAQICAPRGTSVLPETGKTSTTDMVLLRFEQPAKRTVAARAATSSVLG